MLPFWATRAFAAAPPAIESDATWTAADSPVSVETDLTVAAGATLTIEPGVSVEMGDGVSIVVEGSLVALGTAEDPVWFGPADGVAAWGSVVFTPVSEPATFEAVDEYVTGSLLRYATFEGGNRALWLDGASPFVDRCTFSGNAYEGDALEGGGAIYLEGGAEPRIAGCTFEDNTADGAKGGAICAYFANPVLQDNVFIGNSSGYGGAVDTTATYSPMVGNRFEDNSAFTEGGAISLYSSSPAFLDNAVTDNMSLADGGGVHVCVSCLPHASPMFLDNVITGNTNVGDGCAGFGAAWLAGFSANDVYDNTKQGEPCDFAWHNTGEEAAWAWDVAVPGNWWGTADADAIDAAVHDGQDDATVGIVDWEPPADGPVAAPTTRAMAVTHSVLYDAPGDPMALYLTLYNPGPERVVDLSLVLAWDDGPRTMFAGEIPGASRKADLYRMTLPADSIQWITAISTTYVERAAMGTWVAALFDADTGEALGEPLASRFEQRELPR